MKTFPASPIKDNYWIGIEVLIQRIFFDVVYKDLFALTSKEQELYNSRDPLSDAIIKATVAYNDGSFFGKFDSATTKQLKSMGAIYNRSKRTWRLPESQLTDTVKMALVDRGARDVALNSKALSIIDSVDIKRSVRDSGIREAYNKAVGSMSSDISKAIGIKATFTDEQRTIIADEWANNLNLYITNFLEENISELRKDVSENTLRGQRAKNLVKNIESRYGVTKSKAKFLARQETSLLMSKVRETRYKGAGLRKYKWSTSGDERVRSRHKELDGKVFFWDEPPIVDEKGNRANPGQDFNCRCIARPIIE